MPELPEVEYTARQMRTSIVGATISEALVFWERVIGYPGLSEFLAEIAGLRVEGVRRRGKFLLLDLGGGNAEGLADEGHGNCPYVLTMHRRMTGNLLLLPPGWEIDTSARESDPGAWSTRGPVFKHAESAGEREEVMEHVPAQPWYCRVCLNFTDGRRLLFNDLRKFGRLELWPREQEAEALAGLGPEPLGSEFTATRLQEILAGRKRAIKQVLLEQEVVAGLGNIYADESLFYAAIHPLRPANSLTGAEVKLLHEGIVAVLLLGIEHGGTSFSNYRSLWGEAGDNYNHVRVYQQDGRPCTRCGTIIERIVVAQRGTHFCPSCQR
ncbi:MAG: bifunctional DNA-formamidopyrimidine glycosylase/DNA-(apurinic or apyrimidinic site) lyase [Ktedonobacteraceae bacterium]|nr:bifunctional DNA-formamidopyrimidine glycosylase/DNA-(apurinic or apyrimidinic site) lyase [Chloroflexota bacterium]